MFWLATLAGRMGPARLWRGFDAILGVIVVVGVDLVLFGLLFAVPLTPAAFLLAVVKSVRRRTDDRDRRAAWIWTVLSAAGFVLGLSILGQLP